MYLMKLNFIKHIKWSNLFLKHPFLIKKVVLNKWRLVLKAQVQNIETLQHI